MGNFSFSSRSKGNLEGVHPDLVRIAHKALELTTMDFVITDGVRTTEEQKRLVAQGKSKTMNSRHLTGHAIDIVPYPISWDWKDFYPVADAFISACHHLNIPLRWGGNWRQRDLRTWTGSAKELHKAYTGTFSDGPHWEMPRSHYP